MRRRSQHAIFLFRADIHKPRDDFSLAFKYENAKRIFKWDLTLLEVSVLLESLVNA